MDNYKERIERAYPVFKEMLQRPTPFFRQVLVAGGAAGKIAVADIKKGDQLVSVMESAATSAVLTDRTSEFVANTDDGWIIREDGNIDNTGGTDTTGDSLLVAWVSWSE